MKVIIGEIEYVDGDAYVHRVSRLIETDDPLMVLDSLEKDWIVPDFFKGDIHVRDIFGGRGEWITLNRSLQ